MAHHQGRITLTIGIVVSLLLVSLTAAQDILKVGAVSAAPGEKKSGYIIVPAGKDGPEVSIPVTVINGTKQGPVLALVAGVHGYEYPPILALQKLQRQLDPDRLSGAVILVHVANPPSFFKRTIYYNPHDWVNLNRAFPGKIDGTMCERIAYQISKEVIDNCDYLIDNHCGDGNEDLMTYMYCPVTGDPVLDKKTREMALNYGIKVIIEDLTRPKDPSASVYCGNTALLRGKAAITIESGKLGRTDLEDIECVVTGSYNTMKQLGMFPGKPEIVAEPVWVKRYEIIRAEHEGLFYPLVGRSHHVQKGELVGYLTDFFGTTIQQVRAPFNGIVLYIIATPPMSAGEPMASIGEF